MAQGDILITVVGNLTNDPELRFTPSGAAVASFTVASTPRVLDRQTNEWKDGEARSCAATSGGSTPRTSPSRSSAGMRVIVNGRLKQRSYETKEGEKRTVYESRSTSRPRAAVRHRQGHQGRRGGGGGFGGGSGGDRRRRDDPVAAGGGRGRGRGGSATAWGSAAAAGSSARLVRRAPVLRTCARPDDDRT